MRVVHVRRDALARTGGLHSNDATPDDPVTTHEMDRARAAADPPTPAAGYSA